MCQRRGSFLFQGYTLRIIGNSKKGANIHNLTILGSLFYETRINNEPFDQTYLKKLLKAKPIAPLDPLPIMSSVKSKTIQIDYSLQL